MAKFVPDIKSNRWVIISPGRVSRSYDNLPSPPRSGDPTCPFEPGTEALNREIYRVGGQPGDPNWRIRVIANKYPITDVHEVIIHGPEHDKDIDEMPLSQVELILATYRQRYNYHVSNQHGQVLIFNNHDIHAGASISHPHSQLVVVPRQINMDAIPKEPVQNEVARSRHFVVYCPDFSQWPYEVWVVPSRGVEVAVGEPATFGQITDEEIADLAILLQKILRFIIKRFAEPGALAQKVEEHVKLRDIPYNYYIYHGPDWYLRIIPRLIHRAGFELGTGLSVNIVDPVDAAEEYRAGLQ